MVKLFSGLFLAAALVQCAYAHMVVISPPPRSGIVANELQKPCGGANTLTTNVTTVSASVPFSFVLEPRHGTGNIVLSYFTDSTVTNSSVPVFIESTDVPKAGQYKIPVTFDNHGLQNGQAIVVQAIYNGTDSGETDEYFACFDIKLSADASTSSGSPDAESNSESGGDDGIDSSSEQKSSSAVSLLQSSPSMTKLALGIAVSLFAAAGFF